MIIIEDPKKLAGPAELPGKDTLYEHTWDQKKKKWVPWGNLVPNYVHDPDRKFYDILVPTVETVRIWTMIFSCFVVSIRKTHGNQYYCFPKR